ncbi:MAG: DUF2169 domain-containing protein [Oceanihabitans sp.]
MEFINNTSFHTLIHRAALDNDKIAMAVMCRITYTIQEDGSLKISDTQDWELHQEQWESDYGPMDTDNVYNKGGVDIMVFGSAKTPNGNPITESEVVIYLNNEEIHKIKVFGDRKWKSFLGSLSISSPEPFTEIPLTLHNAFGGSAKWDGLDVPYPANPFGKGYYYTKEEAVGAPLPNIEHSNDLIKKWNSWQEPAGISSFPIMSLKAKYNLVLNEDNTKIKKLDKKFFNSAFPNLIVKELKEDDSIKIKGVTTNKDFKIIIPKTNLDVDIKLGEKITNRKLYIDQVGIFPNENKAFISYRFPFRYIVKPMEIRETTLNHTL